MGYQKQPELNGAYYGPPIPPPQQSYHRHRGGGGGRGCCCLFDCLCDCGCCLLGCVFKIIFTILIILGLIVLVIYLILRPHEIKFHATSATLSTFNLTSTDTPHINYNLAVNFTVRNPNRRIGIYYDQIEANAIYLGQRLKTVEGERFYQGHKNTSEFGPLVFKGENQGLTLGSDDKEGYNLQRSNNLYDIVVKLNLRVRFKVGLFKFGTYKPKVKCDLKVPLEGKSSEKFEATRCRYDL